MRNTQVSDSGKHRPLGISFIAVVTGFYGVIFLLVGVFSVVLFDLLGGVILLAFAVFSLVLSLATWKLKRWAFYANLIICFSGMAGFGFYLLSSVESLYTGGFIASAVLLWYIYSRRAMFTQ